MSKRDAWDDFYDAFDTAVDACLEKRTPARLSLTNGDGRTVIVDVYADPGQMKQFTDLIGKAIDEKKGRPN